MASPTVSKIIIRAANALFTSLIYVLVMVIILLIVKGFEIREQNQLARKALHWMETQTYPDTCGYQGEFGKPYYDLPCFTKNGYRFVSGTQHYGQWSAPFQRIVKVRPNEEWTMHDVIVSWTNDWLINDMQLHTGSTADLQDLIKAIPEIGQQP